MKHGLPSTYAFRVSKLNMCLDVCSHSSSEQLVFGHSQGEEDSREREATPIATMDFSHTFSVLLKYKWNLIFKNEKIDTFLIPKYKIKILKNKMLVWSRAFLFTS